MPYSRRVNAPGGVIGGNQEQARQAELEANKRYGSIYLEPGLRSRPDEGTRGPGIARNLGRKRYYSRRKVGPSRTR